MNELGIADILTEDTHFVQVGWAFTSFPRALPIGSVGEIQSDD